MKKFLLFSIVLILGVYASEAQCRFTYDQGYAVGKDLGETETFLREHWTIAHNTADDFAMCTEYARGVLEGYYAYQYTETARNRSGGSTPTGSDDLYGGGDGCTTRWVGGQWVTECE